MTKHFISLSDYDRPGLVGILDMADEYKKNPIQPVLRNKVLGLIFTKSSTRTRVSFEVAIMHLGGHSIFLSSRDIQTGRGETFADTARVLSRYMDIIAMRTHSHEDITDCARHASIPVVNGLSDLTHPCQVMADLMTIREKGRPISDMTIAYVGDGANNMARSWINACAIFGFKLNIAAPQGYLPELAPADRPAGLTLTSDPRAAADGADVLYTDVWVSMGQENEKAARLKEFEGYQINSALLSLASKDALVMHCLPAHRGEEISAEVLDGPNSVVFDQAENRLHINKAIFTTVLKP